ncbi:MAG: hypothetical protein ABJ013_05135 [Halioglobus sp.]
MRWIISVIVLIAALFGHSASAGGLSLKDYLQFATGTAVDDNEADLVLAGWYSGTIAMISILDVEAKRNWGEGFICPPENQPVSGNFMKSAILEHLNRVTYESADIPMATVALEAMQAVFPCED